MPWSFIGEVRRVIIQKCVALNTGEIILRSLKALATDGLSAIELCIYPAFQVLAKLASKGMELLPYIIYRCPISPFTPRY